MRSKRSKQSHFLRNSILLLLLTTILAGISLLGYHYVQVNTKPSVAILPLDSRPCNTQYAQVLGSMAYMDVLLPPEDILDDFLIPSDEEKLWHWLKQEALTADCLVIFTNQLFNGGLIASRDAATYEQISAQIERLADFCQLHSDKQIIVATILPRLKPTQFNDRLWLYEAALTQWARDWDQALAENLPRPDPPADVPTQVVRDYLALYNQTEQLVVSMAQLADKGIINRYIIGQDDAEEWSFSNIIYREMASRNQSSLTTIHGADELTMLILANMVSTEPKPVRIVYTNPDKMDTYYPYEAADLQTIVATKLAFAGLYQDEQAADVIVIHNDQEQSQYAQDLIITERNHYVGVADISYANKGDISLANTLFRNQYFDQISCYAGWNTASNTIGTVIAHYRLSDYLAQHYAWYSPSAKALVQTSLMQFKYLRWAEDQLYQGHIAPQLIPLLQEQELIDDLLIFEEGKKEAGEALLQQYNAVYQQDLIKLMNGQHTLYLGGQTISFRLSDCQSTTTFPWNRAFEIRTECRFTISS